MFCVFETTLFQLHGFKTSLLVCDGASSNVSAIKASHDFQGAYSLNEKLEDKYLIELWMINPFNPPCKLFWLICPSHQVCSIMFVMSCTLAHTKLFFVLFIVEKHDQRIVFI